MLKIQKETASSSSRRNVARWGIALAVAILIAIFWVFFREQLTLENLAAHESALRARYDSNPILFFVAAFLFYVLVAGLALPGAAALSLVFAWFFGFWRALFVISFASTAGATICFLLSRFLIGDAVRNRMGKRLESFDASFDRDGAFYLFTVRLIPAIPFFLINLMAGLTSIGTWTFWWVSQIGMLPGTIVFVYAGSTFPTLEELANHGLSGILNFKVVLAFALLGIFPWIARKILHLFSNAKSDNP